MRSLFQLKPPTSNPTARLCPSNSHETACQGHPQTRLVKSTHFSVLFVLNLSEATQTMVRPLLFETLSSATRTPAFYLTFTYHRIPRLRPKSPASTFSVSCLIQSQCVWCRPHSNPPGAGGSLLWVLDTWIHLPPRHPILEIYQAPQA